jgi:dienelactone hydrolase
MQILSRYNLAVTAAVSVILLTGCGGGSTGATVNNSAARGTLIENPPYRVASLNAPDFTALLSAQPGGSSLIQLATGQAGGTLNFGVDVYYFKYETVGGAGETATASGALMVPTGPNGASLGPRPIILYAHGTETYQPYNMANVLAPADDRIPMVAAVFASNGFIVVAPNYVGYDSSSLPYGCYFNGDQQSKDMIDALTAARTALSSGGLFASAPKDNGKLFITGYSQGGHVAMATHKAMQAAEMTVTASAPCSGPYALAANVDAIMLGKVNWGATEFTPLLTSSYFNSYKGNATIGNIYTVTGTSADAYEAAWATGIDSRFPGATDDNTMNAMILEGQYPLAEFNSVSPTASDIAAGLAADGITGAAATALTTELTGLFPTITPDTSNPLFAIGFAPTTANPGPHLVKNSFRVSIAADALANPDGAVAGLGKMLPMPAATPGHPLRKAAALSDLRGWAPASPVLMIGGHNDPEVFYPLNTGLMSQIFSGMPSPVPQLVQTPVDIDPGIDFAALANTTGTAFGTDVAHGVTSSATYANDIMTAVGTALTPSLTNFPSAINNPLQQGFLQATGQAIATVITPANLSAIFQQVTGTATPTAQQLGANAQAIATAIGTSTETILIEAYHSHLVAPFAHVAALQFFSQF